MMKLLVRSLQALIACVLLLVGTDVLANIILGYPPVTKFVLHDLPFRGVRFTPEKWRVAGNCEGLTSRECSDKEYSCTRGGMVRSLTRNHLSDEGSNRERIDDLLGKQEFELKIGGANCSGYDLGWCSGFKVDPDSLYVCYDRSDAVSSTGTIQH